MNWGDVGALLVGIGGFVTAVVGWVKTRRDALRESSSEKRTTLELHLERQDKEIERQAEKIDKQDAKIDSLRRQHRAEMDKMEERMDEADARVRVVFDYASVLRQHINDGKPPPPPPWPRVLTVPWGTDKED